MSPLNASSRKTGIRGGKEAVAPQGSDKPLLLLVDGHHVAYRLYFARQGMGGLELKTSTGVPTTITYNFLNVLNGVILKERPDAIAVVMDSPGGNFRHKLYPEYKANRNSSSHQEDMSQDFVNLRRLLKCLNIPILQEVGYEGDDIIGMATERAVASNYQVKILTGDQDLYQLVSDDKGVSVLMMVRGRKIADCEEHHNQQVKEKLGVWPEQVVDFKSLKGDGSDNIKGVPGIGEKGARSLLEQFGTLEGIYEHLDEVKETLARKLKDGREEAILAKKLVQICTSGPEPVDVATLHTRGIDRPLLLSLLEELEVKGFSTNKVDQLQQALGAAVKGQIQQPVTDPDFVLVGPDEVGAGHMANIEVMNGEPGGGLDQPVMTGDRRMKAKTGGTQGWPRTPSLSTSSVEVGAAVSVEGNGTPPVATEDHLLTGTRRKEGRKKASSPVADGTLNKAGALEVDSSQVEAWEGSRKTRGRKKSGSGQDTNLAVLGPLSNTLKVSAVVASELVGGKKPRIFEIKNKDDIQQLVGSLAQALGPVAICMNCASRALVPAAGSGRRKTKKTSQTDPHLVDMALSWQPAAGEPLTAAVWWDDGTFSSQQDEVKSLLAQLLTDASVEKVVPSAKDFLSRVKKYFGVDAQGVVFDTSLAQYVVSQTGLPVPSEAVTYDKSEDLLSPTASESVAEDLPSCVVDSMRSMDQFLELKDRLEADGKLKDLYFNLELPLQKVLAEMELTGVKVEKTALERWGHQLRQEIATIEQQGYRLAGREFNFNSNKQLSTLLFEDLKLDTNKTRANSQGYTVDHMVLEKLKGDHEIVDLVLRHRSLSKLLNTYVDALPPLVDPATSRVHATINPTTTATGRLSYSDPNLQQIPARGEGAREIRRTFICDDGHLLVSADYSQIELRLLAHMSEEPLLVDAFQRGEDIHTATARQLYDTDEVTKEQRSLAKAINFGVMYGMGPKSLAEQTKMTLKDAKGFIKRFSLRYPKAFSFLKECQQKAVAMGYVETILGRRRYFDFTSEQLKKWRGSPLEEMDVASLKGVGPRDAALLRQATNTPLQGSGADIMKMALLKVHKLMQAYDARLLLSIHDEIVLEVPESCWEELRPKLEAAMSTAVELKVPLEVNISAGKNWADMQ